MDDGQLFNNLENKHNELVRRINKLEDWLLEHPLFINYNESEDMKSKDYQDEHFQKNKELLEARIELKAVDQDYLPWKTARDKGI